MRDKRTQRRQRLCAAVGLALAASGCSAVSPYADPFSRGGEGASPAIVTVDWWKPLLGEDAWQFMPKETAQPAAEIDPATRKVVRVVTLTKDGVVRSFDPSGALQWAYRTGGPFSAGAAIRNGVVYASGGDGFLYALRAATGELLWKYAAGEELATTPSFGGGKVLVASHGDAIFAVEEQTGKWVWQYRRDPPTGFTVRGASAPVVSGTVAYAGFSDGTLVALALDDGSVKWERALSTPGGQFLDVDTAPALDPDTGRLVVASYKDGIFAVNGETGEVGWRVERGGTTDVLRRGQVLFAAGDEGVSALAGENGRAIWHYQAKDAEARMPLLVQGHLVAPMAGALVFLDPVTGRQRLWWDPGAGVSATPLWVGQRLYVLSNQGYLYALTVARGG